MNGYTPRPTIIKPTNAASTSTATKSSFASPPPEAFTGAAGRVEAGILAVAGAAIVALL